MACWMQGRPPGRRVVREEIVKGWQSSQWHGAGTAFGLCFISAVPCMLDTNAMAVSVDVYLMLLCTWGYVAVWVC